MATVEELTTQASEAAADILTQAETFLDALAQKSSVIFSEPGFNIDALIPNKFDYSSVPLVSIGTISTPRPDVSIAAAGGPPAVPALAPLTNLTPISLPVDDLLAPTNDFSYFEAAYQSILLDPLQVKLLNDLNFGGFGIDTDDEAALFNRFRDRATEVTQTRIDEAGRTMAARGFPLPPGELSVAIDRAYQEFQSKASDASREIFVNSAARFVENRKFTIQEVRQIETVTIGFHNSVQERALNAAKATAEFSIAVYNVLLERFKTRLSGAKITADTQLAQAQVDVERSRAILERYRVEVTAYTADVGRLVEGAKLRLGLYSADVESDGNFQKTLVAQAQLQTSAILATGQQNILTTQATISAAKAKLLATVEALKFQTESAKFGADKFFATLTAMYGSINSLAVQSKED